MYTAEGFKSINNLEQKVKPALISKPRKSKENTTPFPNLIDMNKFITRSSFMGHSMKEITPTNNRSFIQFNLLHARLTQVLFFR